MICNSTCIEGHLPPLSQGHSFSKMSPHDLPPDHSGLAVTVKYSHSTICWQENITVLALPSQCRCWQSAEPGGHLKKTTFLPLLRNPEKYQNTTPTFPFPKYGLSPDQEQLSHTNALAAGCLGQEQLGLQPKGQQSASFF